MTQRRQHTARQWQRQVLFIPACIGLSALLITACSGSLLPKGSRPEPRSCPPRPPAKWCLGGALLETLPKPPLGRTLQRLSVRVWHPTQGKAIERTFDRLWHVRQGRPLTAKALKDTLGRFREAYGERGYLHAKIKACYQSLTPERGHLFFEVRTGSRILGQVRFKGNRAVASRDIQKIIYSHPSTRKRRGVFSESKLFKDVLYIRALYYDRGYINVKVVKPQIRRSRCGWYLHLIFPIVEGKRYRIGKLDSSHPRSPI